MTHFAIRGLMHEAALEADRDPDKLSFLHAVRVVRRKLSKFPIRRPGAEGARKPGVTKAIVIVM